jgi:hypothetical protein
MFCWREMAAAAALAAVAVLPKAARQQEEMQ